MVSHGRSIFEDGGFKENLQIEVHLPNVENIKEASLCSPDYPDVHSLPLIFQDKDALILTIPKHRTASIIYLKM